MPRNANQSKSSNYSLDFGGSNQYISSSPTFSGLTDVTVSCWAKFENINNNDFQYVLIAYNTSQSGSYRVGIGMIKSDYSTVSDRYKLYTIDGSNLNISSFVVSQDVWYNIVVTQSGTVRKLFVNGDLISTFTGVPSLNLGNNLEIGRFSNNNHYFPGKINSVSIFDYALSESQVTTLWGGGTSVSNPMALPRTPIAYYPLGESAGGFVGGSGTWLTENNAIGDYVFDFEQSSSQNIDIGSSTLFDSTSAFSFSTWCKLESYDNIFPAFIRLKTDQSTGFIMGFSNSATYYGVWFGSSSNFLTARTAGDISADLLGVWKHISLVYDGVDRTAISSYSLYINGVPQSLVSSGSFGATPNTNLIGQGNTASTFWDGEISNTQIWNTNLSSSEITTLYNYGSPIQTLANIPQNSNLKAWYKLDASDIYNSTTTEWEVSDATAAIKTTNLANPGSNYYNNSGNNLVVSGDTSFTVSTWFYASTTPGSGQTIILMDFPGSAGNNIYLAIQSDSKIRAIINNHGGWSIGNTVTLNQWNLISLTWDASVTASERVKFYINGQPAGFDNTGADVTMRQSTGARISAQGSGTYTSKVLSSNAITWSNIALTSSEVLTLYNSFSPVNGIPTVQPSSISSFPQSSNITGWFKLDGNGLDSSGSLNNALPVGSPISGPSLSNNNGESSGMSQANLVQSDLQTVAPYSKYALNFDAASADSITINADLSSYSSITVSTWAKFVSSTGFQYIFDAGTYNASGPAGIKLGISKKQTTNEIATTDGLTNHSTGVNVALNTWYHITVTHAGTTRKVYLNGSLIGTFVSGNLNLNAINYIGKFSINTNFMDGSISNVSIWDTDLTSAQVTEIYNEGLPSDLNSHSTYSNLVSWWQLGENSSFDGNDWIVADEKGTNNGTSVSMPVGALVNGVGTTANGVSASMGVGSLVGDAPYSTANALSSGMSVVSRVTGSGNTP